MTGSYNHRFFIETRDMNNIKAMELQMASEKTEPASTNLTNEEVEQYLRTALEAGKIALENGAETARCDSIINNILRASGSEDFVTSVISTSIIASLNGKTQIVTIKNWSTNLNKISVANEVAQKVADGNLEIQEARKKLHILDHTTNYNFLLRLLSYVIVTISMPILMNGTFVDCAAAAGCGIVMAFIDALFRRIRIHAFASITIQALIMVLCGSLIAILSQGRVTLDIIMTSAITPLFPGLALTNAVRDTLQGDYVSGAGRLLEANVKALAIALGAALGLLVATLITGPLREQMLDTPYGIIADNAAIFWIYAAAALFYSAGYCILFEVTPKYIIWGSLVGCVGKTLALFINYQTGTEVMGTFLATVATAILAQILSRIFKTPAIPFLIAGIMALVPGGALYTSVLLIITGSVREGGARLLEALMIAGAIAVAIFLIDTIFLTAHRIRRKRIMKRS